MKFSDLVDIRKLQQLLDAMYAATGMPSAILDNDANFLTSSGWQDICRNYHRICPETLKRCHKNDVRISEYLADGKHISYKCDNGLYDCACPIIIDGQHVASLFVGQYFTAEPDLDFFKQQARTFGFDENGYLDAVQKVPIMSEEKVSKVIEFFSQLAWMLANLGFQVLQAKAANNFKDILLESIPNPVFFKDSNGVYLSCNKAFTEFLGLAKTEIVGMKAADIAPSHLANIYNQMDAALLESKQNQSFEYNVADAFGTERNVICNKASFTNADKSTGVVGVILDITARKQVETQLKESEENYHSLFKHMINGFAFLQATPIDNRQLNNFIILDVNEEYEEMLGQSREYVINRTITEVLLPNGLGDEIPEWLAVMNKVYNTGESSLLEYHSKIYSKWFRLSIYSPKKGYLGVVVSDITKAKLSAAEIQKYAYQDYLTGLPNRRLLDDRLADAIVQAKITNTNIAVIFLDLDNFKPVNDTYGHDAGDKLLQHLANRIIRCVRDCDTVSRIGGDEFVVILPDIREKEEAELMAVQLLEACRKPFIIKRTKLYVTASIGVSMFPYDGTNITELIRNSDMAMYKSKRKGRNQVRFVDECG